MARVWPIEPVVPSPTLMALAHSLVGEAERLLDVRVSRAQREVERLAHSLAIWSVTVERMATTGPAYLADTARRFEDHPRFGEREPLTRHRALADLYAFLAIGGDIVLDDLARAVLGRGHRSPGTRDTAWNTLVRAFDGPGRDARSTVAVRRLFIGLRVARHRLVAHARPDFYAMTGWGHDDSPVVRVIPVRLPEQAVRRMAALQRDTHPTRRCGWRERRPPGSSSLSSTGHR